MVPDLDDAKQRRLCAEEIRTAAEDMLGERAMALQLAEDYDRLARHAEATFQDGGRPS
jgi:hypothetical protein